MRKLEKDQKPEILSKNEVVWRDEYIAGKAAGTLTNTQRFRYRHPEIKSALRNETYEKCAYCESKVSHVHPGETDHILPISECPELCVEWENLTFVCSECNRRKSNYFDEELPLVNPYTDNPYDHLTFLGPLVLHKDNKGLVTKRTLGLDRTALFEKKQELIERMASLLHQWRDMPAGRARAMIKKEIESFALTTAEYSAMTNTYLQLEMPQE